MILLNDTELDPGFKGKIELDINHPGYLVFSINSQEDQLRLVIPANAWQSLAIALQMMWNELEKLTKTHVPVNEFRQIADLPLSHDRMLVVYLHFIDHFAGVCFAVYQFFDGRLAVDLIDGKPNQMTVPKDLIVNFQELYRATIAKGPSLLAKLHRTVGNA